MKINQAYKRADGTYVVDGYHVCSKVVDPYGKYNLGEVENYLFAHPEALIPEPKPPEPNAEQKATQIRLQRNNLLSESDKYLLEDLFIEHPAFR